jgi:hypothetical protein
MQHNLKDIENIRLTIDRAACNLTGHKYNNKEGYVLLSKVFQCQGDLNSLMNKLLNRIR